MILEAKNIDKSFSEHKVLNSINLTARGGKALGLLGRNGAGKTTTIRIIMNVFPSDSGEVLIDGKPADYTMLRIGYLPEERGLYAKKTIINQLVYFAELKGMKRADAVASIDYWLKRLHMDEYRNKHLDTLSKGNQQKIQLITAISADPDIIILDEPFSGLDPVNSMLLKDVVRELIDKGKIVLFSSHQMNYIEEFCDDIVIINGGKIVLAGELKHIIHNYSRDKLVVISKDSDKIKNSISEKSHFDGDKLIIQLRNPSDKMKIMKTITDSFDVDQIKVFEPSLNDIFVEYTQDQI